MAWMPLWVWVAGLSTVVSLCALCALVLLGPRFDSERAQTWIFRTVVTVASLVVFLWLTQTVFADPAPDFLVRSECDWGEWWIWWCLFKQWLGI